MKVAVGLALAALLILVGGAAAAQTYEASGSNQNGVWGSTLYIGDNGELGVSIIGVVGGTYSSIDPHTSVQQQNLGTSITPILTQQYTIDAQNGQGFASCTLDDAQGNHADTYVLVENGVVNTDQSVGFVDDDYLSAVYSTQGIWESEADDIQAEASSESAEGDWAEVETYVSGSINWLGQIAGTGTVTVPDVFSGGWIPESANGAVAAQIGDVGSRCNPAAMIYTEANSLGSDGESSVVTGYVENGFHDFVQAAGTGTVTWPSTITGSFSGDSGIEPPSSVTGSFAGQAGYIGSGHCVENFALVNGTSTDTNGDTSFVETEIEDGKLAYGQLTAAGTIEWQDQITTLQKSDVVIDTPSSITGALAAQVGSVQGGRQGAEYGSASAGSTGSSGDTADVRAMVADGELSFIQVTTAGTIEWPDDDASVNGALAAQAGYIDGSRHGADYGSATACTSGNEEDSGAKVSARVADGTLEFGQIAATGTIDISEGSEIPLLSNGFSLFSASGSVAGQDVSIGSRHHEAEWGMAKAESWAANGDEVEASARLEDGTLRVSQLTGTGTVDYTGSLPNVFTNSVDSLSGTFALQDGSFGGHCTKVDEGSIRTSAENEDGDKVVSFAEVGHGTMDFYQISTAEANGITASDLESSQAISLRGKSGEVGALSAGVPEGNYSLVKAKFRNWCSSGSLTATTSSSLTIDPAFNGDWLQITSSNNLHDFDIYARNQTASASQHSTSYTRATATSKKVRIF